ncbi:MAG: transglycosylase SLT domain-containing protein [Gemmataceae bacterium]
MDKQTRWLLLVIIAVVALGWGGYTVLTEYQNRQKWGPVIAATEQKYGLPSGLLARQAQQESSYESAIISGSQASSAGALGILQLEPAYFPSVRAPVPFSDAAVTAQIDAAGAEMRRLYDDQGSWVYALAAYNWGEANLNSFASTGSPPIPAETAAYVADITADVPAANDAVLS